MQLQGGDVLAQRGLIVLGDEKVVGLFILDEITGGILLGMQRIGRDHSSLDRQGIKKLGEFGNFIGLLFDSDLAQHDRFLMENSAEQMRRGLLGIVSAP